MLTHCWHCAKEGGDWRHAYGTYCRGRKCRKRATYGIQGTQSIEMDFTLISTGVRIVHVTR